MFFDLVIIEPILPGTDGFALIKLLKKTGKSIPIIALTVCALKGEREKCLQHGCDAYISKPFIIKNLIHVIEQYI